MIHDRAVTNQNQPRRNTMKYTILSILLAIGAMLAVATPVLADTYASYHCHCGALASGGECSCSYQYDLGKSETKEFRGYCDYVIDYTDNYRDNVNKKNTDINISGRKDGTTCTIAMQAFPDESYTTRSCTNWNPTVGDTLNIQVKCYSDPANTTPTAYLKVGPNASSASNCGLHFEACMNGQFCYRTVMASAPGATVGSELKCTSGCPQWLPENNMLLSLSDQCGDSAEIDLVSWRGPISGSVGNFDGEGSTGGTFWMRNDVLAPTVGGVGNCTQRRFLTAEGTSTCSRTGQ